MFHLDQETITLETENFTFQFESMNLIFTKFEKDEEEDYEFSLKNKAKEMKIPINYADDPVNGASMFTINDEKIEFSTFSFEHGGADFKIKSTPELLQSWNDEILRLKEKHKDEMVIFHF